MIVFDLSCVPSNHVFEGWFSSTSDYEEQRISGMLTCPFCNSAEIVKAVMAPNISAKGNQSKSGNSNQPGENASVEQRFAKESANSEGTDVQSVSNNGINTAELTRLVGELAKAQKKALEKSTWVGDKFADKARAIHYGDAPEQQIHGSATAEDAKALDDEGVEIAPLPLPIVSDDLKN